MNILRNFFPYSVVFLVLLFACTSFYRFLVLQDYVVAYEGECDPVTESCFIGCDDESCTSEYYYSTIERHSREIYALCGPNILECEAAQTCNTGSGFCSVTYCDPEVDGRESCTLPNEDI
jgi:hypothetical protein